MQFILMRTANITTSVFVSCERVTHLRFNRLASAACCALVLRLYVWELVINELVIIQHLEMKI